MRKLCLILYLFTGIQTIVVGQTNWESKFNGYVITHDDQVVKGYLKYEGSNVDRGTKIMLYKKPNDTPQIFYSLELQAYAMKKDTFRIINNLQPFPDDKMFMERAEAKLEQRGKLTLFSIEFFEQAITPGVFLYVPSSGGAVGVVGGVTPQMVKRKIFIIMDSKDEIIGVDRDHFQEVMHEVLADTPSLLEKIDKKILKYSDLKKIISEYNTVSN